MSRVRVQLFAHHQRSKRRASRDEMGRGVAELALAFKEARAWKTITIEVIHIYHQDKLMRKSRNPVDSIKFACTLWPLRYVRHRYAVTINGLSSKLIADLPTLMTSTDQVVDLLLAYNALKEYMQTVMGDDFKGRNQGPQYRGIGSQNLLCGRAVRHGDVDGFIRARSRIIAILAYVILDQESNVYGHDPYDWDSGPRLYVSRPDGESPAPLQDEDVVEDEDRPLCLNPTRTKYSTRIQMPTMTAKTHMIVGNSTSTTRTKGT